MRSSRSVWPRARTDAPDNATSTENTIETEAAADINAATTDAGNAADNALDAAGNAIDNAGNAVENAATPTQRPNAAD